MSRIITLITLIAGVAGFGEAQRLGTPSYGDLVVTCADANLLGGGTVFFAPNTPAKTTILGSFPQPGYFDNWVRMAPNNRDLVISRVDATASTFRSSLIKVTPAGGWSTIAALGRVVDGFALDHDGRWIASARDFALNATTRSGYLLAIDHLVGSATTLASIGGIVDFNNVCIDRDPGALPYTIVTCCKNAPVGPDILQADRNGTLVTIVNSLYSTVNHLTVALDPRTGDYIVGATDGAFRVTKSGIRRTLTTTPINALRIEQDDTAWMVSTAIPPSLVKFDLATGTPVSVSLIGTPANHFATGIERFGSRALVCLASGSRSVTVALNSANSGQRYQLACSATRRPGTKLPTGDWLDLGIDGLFVVSARNLAPSIFSGFAGTTDSAGRAVAAVNIPAGVPSGLTIFVAGVVFNASSILEVTNTHWFVT